MASPNKREDILSAALILFSEEAMTERRFR